MRRTPTDQRKETGKVKAIKAAIMTPKWTVKMVGTGGCWFDY